MSGQPTGQANLDFGRNHTRTIKFTIQYDGTDFHGWQSQTGKRTVQDVMKEALKPLGDPNASLMASGRTDAGVHALGQVVGYRTRITRDLASVQRSVNFYLPEDVRVIKTEEAPLDFSATSDATGKTYRYVIHNSGIDDVIWRRFSARVKEPLQVPLMREAALPLLGTHDFRCFESQWPNRHTSVRTLRRLDIRHLGKWITIEMEADGFLYNMARSIVGSLVEIGRGHWPKDRIQRALETLDRDLGGPVMPAKGLFLVKVDYPQ